MDKWSKRVAVVTGATSAIGAEIALTLVRSGMTVVGLGRKKERIEGLKARLYNAPGDLTGIECDITNEQSVQNAFIQVVRAFGGVDVLVNVAAITSSRLFLHDENNHKEFQKLIDTNITALCICSREAVKYMKGRHRGHIININSAMGHKTPVTKPGVPPMSGMYPASKYAVNAITECLRQELLFLKTNIRVSTINPGLVEQDPLTGPHEHESLSLMPRLRPDDVSRAVIFALAQPETVQIHDIVLKPVGETL